MSEVQKRVEALRQAKKAEEDAAENKRKDELIQWEAEMILALEEYTDERIIKEFTDDMDKFEYLYKLLPNLGYQLMITSEVSRPSKVRDIFGRDGSAMVKMQSATRIMPAHIQNYLITENHDEKAFKARYVYGYLMTIIEKTEYIEKERVRKEKEKFLAQKIAEEKRMAKETKDQEERVRRQQIIDETNKAVNKLLENNQHTFTNLTLSDWNKRYEKQFIFSSKKGDSWNHYTVNNDKGYSPCYSGMPSSFVNYYEEGKVPFYTKCPTCNSPTKFNYLNMAHGTGYGGCESQRSCQFSEVYCDNHYFYNASRKKHYRVNPSGSPVHFNHPMQGAWHIQCWNPSGKWKEWDPSDPDGSKAAAEKKRKEAEEIQKQITEREKQIAELQAKLTVLQN